MSAHPGDASLLDRVAIVTGAARGLGAVVAEKLQAEGAKVVLADVLVEEGRETAAHLAKRLRSRGLTSRARAIGPAS